MYIDKYGLTNSKPNEEGAENGFLWTLQTIILEDHQKARIASLKRSIQLSRVGQGLYAQNPSHVVNKAISTFHKRDAYMSPDQLIVIMMTSYCYGSGIHREILQEIKNQGYLQYNNLKDGEKRYIHPRDLVLYYALSYPKFANLLLPLLVIACVVSCLKSKEHTSGKLLAWTKCMMLKDYFITMKIGYYLCTLAIKKNHKDWAEVFEIYFPYEDHINRKLAQRKYRGN